ncbi:DUF4357 domain-containing protein, partial [Pseudacidovorax sp. RU35E]|uniref:DUF4357 domain-containing protein n=1 Tax=Pseudacidovorax sp. RU35E TaxID=1907403 RepID=UPI00117BD499
APCRRRSKPRSNLLQPSGFLKSTGTGSGGRSDGEFYVFQEDVPFGSPSGASDVVTGNPSNGWTVWKNKDGKTLDDLKRPKVPAS